MKTKSINQFMIKTVVLNWGAKIDFTIPNFKLHAIIKNIRVRIIMLSLTSKVILFTIQVAFVRYLFYLLVQ